MKPIFFASPAKLRAWFKTNSGTQTEVLIGFHKKHTQTPSITWPESVDEALCVGWIDGVRRRIDDDCYSIRFTPRKKTSIWSAINIERVKVLTKEGRMTPAGLAAFSLKKDNRAGIYSYEQRTVELPEPYAATLKAAKRASTFFHAQPPSYRKTVVWWIVSAKQEETRVRRLAELIAHCREERRIDRFTGPYKAKVKND